MVDRMKNNGHHTHGFLSPVNIPINGKLIAGSLLLAILLLIPALWNGYPLVYSDTGTYIQSGHDLKVPMDRPIGYGLFLRYTSMLWLSLWFPIIVQACLVTIMIIRTWIAVFGKLDWPSLLMLTLLLSIGTAAGWHGGRLQPDIFTSLAILAILLQYFTRPGKWATAFDLGLIVLAGITHLSNIPVSIALLITLLPHALFVRTRTPKKAIVRLLFPLAAIATSLLLLIVINFGIDRKPVIGGGGHVFLIGRLIDAELLQPWLDQDCRTHDHFLCAQREAIPSTSAQLLWWDNSPMNSNGGWNAVRDESNAMLGRFFNEPENLLAFIIAGITDTGKQLLLWGLDHEMISQWYRDPGSPPSTAIRNVVPHELQAYFGSLQNGGRGELRMEEIDLLHYSILIASIISGLFLVLRAMQRRIPASQMYFLFYLITGIVLAAGCGAALSIPDQRFLAKVSWLLPFGVAAISFAHYRSKQLVRSDPKINVPPADHPAPSRPHAG